MEIQEFETTYICRTKHRAKCPLCGQLINDGEKVIAAKVKKEKLYPVKGIMNFVTWKFRHTYHQYKQ